MKKLIILFMIPALMLVASCRTKKSTTDFKQTETQKVSTLITENKEQKSLFTENEQKQQTKSETDKSFIEAWMSFESDKITITDNQGNKTEITNPRIKKKSLKTNDIAKIDQTDIKQEKSAAAEENQQNNVAVSNNRQIKTDLQETNSSKGKGLVWLYVLGAVVFGVFGYFILKRFRLI